LPEDEGITATQSRSVGLSRDFRELIAVVALRGGSRVAACFLGGRMLRFEIGPTISRLSLGIITIGVNHLLCSSCRVATLHSIDATINEMRIKVEEPDSCWVR
jgi:hypothetical protein